MKQTYILYVDVKLLPLKSFTQTEMKSTLFTQVRVQILYYNITQKEVKSTV